MKVAGFKVVSKCKNIGEIYNQERKGGENMEVNMSVEETVNLISELVEKEGSHSIEERGKKSNSAS